MQADTLKGGSGVKAAIKGFLLRSISIPDLADDDDLFESGIVNSLFAVQLTMFIEKTFGIEILAEDLEISNFRSLNATTEFVLKKSTPIAV